jgi:polysaccharide biosynthesis protein PslH
MRVLLLSHRVPYPLNDGGAIVAQSFLQALVCKGVEVHFLSFNTRKHFVAPNVVSDLFAHCRVVQLVDLDNTLSVLGALRNLISAASYNYQRFYSQKFSNALSNLLSQHKYDIVHLENVYMGHYIPIIREACNAVVTVRIHNIEHKIWQRKAVHDSNLMRAWYIRKMAARLKHEELRILDACDYMFGLSSPELIELDCLGIRTPSAFLPLGVNVPKRVHSTSLAGTIYHIASMDWLPNQEAVDWFLTQVMQEVRSLHAGCTLHLAGKSMPTRYFSLLQKDVEVHGEVADQFEFMERYDTMIVPLLSGAGIRVKIIEALALGKKIVSTTVGAEGIDLSDLPGVRIADDPLIFAAALAELLRLPADHGAQEAKDRVRELYDADTVANSLYKYISELCNAQG